MAELAGIPLLRTILPDEFADKLALMADYWRRDKFTLGDMRNTLKAMVEERMLPISACDVDDFLADCLHHEVEPRTIRYYAMISYAFPDPVRDAYRSLPHSHFALAQSYGEKAISVLDMSRDREVSTGRPPSVAWLRAANSGYIYEQNSKDAPEWISYDEEAPCPDCDIQRNYINEPEPVPGWVEGFYHSVEYALQHIDAVCIESEVRQRLRELLIEAEGILQKIKSMV